MKLYWPDLRLPPINLYNAPKQFYNIYVPTNEHVDNLQETNDRITYSIPEHNPSL